MKAVASLALALLVTPFTFPAAAFSQSPPAAAAKAAPTTPAPAAPAKFYRPVKGVAKIEVARGPAKRVGPDMVTVLRIKNMSPGRIDLLQIDEYWYDRKLATVSGSSLKWKKLFNPGDVIEVTMKSPHKNLTTLYRSQYTFSHGGGKIDVTEAKKVE